MALRSHNILLTCLVTLSPYLMDPAGEIQLEQAQFLIGLLSVSYRLTQTDRTAKNFKEVPVNSIFA